MSQFRLVRFMAGLVMAMSLAGCDKKNKQSPEEKQKLDAIRAHGEEIKTNFADGLQKNTQIVDRLERLDVPARAPAGAPAKTKTKEQRESLVGQIVDKWIEIESLFVEDHFKADSENLDDYQYVKKYGAKSGKRLVEMINDVLKLVQKFGERVIVVLFYNDAFHTRDNIDEAAFIQGSLVLSKILQLCRQSFDKDIAITNPDSKITQWTSAVNEARGMVANPFKLLGAMLELEQFLYHGHMTYPEFLLFHDKIKNVYPQLADVLEGLFDEVIKVSNQLGVSWRGNFGAMLMLMMLLGSVTVVGLFRGRPVMPSGRFIEVSSEFEAF